MSRPNLIKKLKEKNPELNQNDFEDIIKIFSSSFEKALINNHNIEIRGFGTFFLKKINQKYSARNPKTGELIYVPEKNKIRFGSSRKLKEIINK